MQTQADILEARIRDREELKDQIARMKRHLSGNAGNGDFGTVEGSSVTTSQSIEQAEAMLERAEQDIARMQGQTDA